MRISSCFYIHCNTCSQCAELIGFLVRCPSTFKVFLKLETIEELCYRLYWNYGKELLKSSLDALLSYTRYDEFLTFFLFVSSTEKTKGKCKSHKRDWLILFLKTGFQREAEVKLTTVLYIIALPFLPRWNFKASLPFPRLFKFGLWHSEGLVPLIFYTVFVSFI